MTAAYWIVVFTAIAVLVVGLVGSFTLGLLDFIREDHR